MSPHTDRRPHTGNCPHTNKHIPTVCAAVAIGLMATLATALSLIDAPLADAAATAATPAADPSTSAKYNRAPDQDIATPDNHTPGDDILTPGKYKRAPDDDIPTPDQNNRAPDEGIRTPGAGIRAPGANIPAPDTDHHASGEDIRDIRGPKGIFPLWLVLAAAAAAALLAWGSYALWRRKRRAPSAPVLRPFEIALQRLEDIRTLMHPAALREFSIAITDIVRRYIEDAFHVTASHFTTEEFLHDLLQSSNATLAAHRGLLAEFLNQCDIAKFAGVSLSTQIMESLRQSARSFVLETSKPASRAEAHEAPLGLPQQAS